MAARPKPSIELSSEQALGKDREEFWAKAAEMLARTRGRRHTPAEILLREARDRRSGLTE